MHLDRVNWPLIAVLCVLAIIATGSFQFIREALEYRSGGGPTAYAHGYQWAKKHGVTDWRLCPEWPEKFNLGCSSYVNEQIDYIESQHRRLAKSGTPCIYGCSGYQAGYAWAQEQDLVTEDECSGQSQSFGDGCVAYVEEHYRR